MSKNVSSFLTKLDKLNDKTIDVFVPSLNKKVPTKPLNLKQQKDLISSILDGIRGTLDFSKTLNKIITDNTGLTDLKVYDKLPFIVALRKNALGNKAGKIELQGILDNIKNIPLEVKDKDGNTVRRLNGPVKKGFHRVAWDLRFPSPNTIALLPHACEQAV